MPAAAMYTLRHNKLCHFSAKIVISVTCLPCWDVTEIHCTRVHLPFSEYLGVSSAQEPILNVGVKTDFPNIVSALINGYVALELALQYQFWYEVRVRSIGFPQLSQLIKNSAIKQ